MNPSTLNLLLWAPFLLVVLFSSIRFVFTGWRRGLLTSLVYLGISILSAIIAIPLARWIAPATSGSLAPRIMAWLPFSLPAENLKSLSRMAGALLLYPEIFFLLALAARFLAGGLLKPIFADKDDKKRIGGLIVGVLHAAIYPMLLLMPLYGTMAAFMPTAQAFIQFVPTQNTKTAAYVQIMADHPVVKIAGSGPIQWYYRGLSSVELDGASLDVAKASDAALDVLEIFQKIRDAEPAQRSAMLPELIRMLDKKVLDTRWCYHLVCSIGLDTVTDVENTPILGEWLISLKGTSREDYRKTVDAVITLAEGLQAQGTLENLLTGEKPIAVLLDAQSAALLDEFLNSTPQTRALRNSLLTYYAGQILFDGDTASARLFVAAVLSNPDTKEILSLETLGALASAETPLAAALYILQHDDISALQFLAILMQNDLLDKLNPDFAKALPGI